MSDTNNNNNTSSNTTVIMAIAASVAQTVSFSSVGFSHSKSIPSTQDEEGDNDRGECGDEGGDHDNLTTAAVMYQTFGRFLEDAHTALLCGNNGQNIREEIIDQGEGEDGSILVATQEETVTSCVNTDSNIQKNFDAANTAPTTPSATDSSLSVIEDDTLAMDDWVEVPLSVCLGDETCGVVEMSGSESETTSSLAHNEVEREGEGGGQDYTSSTSVTPSPQHQTPIDVDAGTDTRTGLLLPSSTQSQRTSRASRGERHRRKDRKNKRRRVDPEEFGFHLSCQPRLPCVDSSMDQSDRTSQEGVGTEVRIEEAVSTNQGGDGDEGSNASASIPNTDEAEAASTTETTVSTATAAATSDTPVVQDVAGDALLVDGHRDVVDDASFFARLGIDIHEDCVRGDDDSFLGWDGVRVELMSQTTPTTSAPSQTASTKCRKSENPFSTKKKRTSSSSQNKTDTKHKFTPLVSTHEFNEPNYKMATHEQIIFLELECNGSRPFYIRRDRHRKREKVHKAVKTAHFGLENIKENKGRKMIHMHHRLLKKTDLDPEIGINFRFQYRSHILPMPKHGVDLKVAKAIRLKPTFYTPSRERVPPAQNLSHVLHETNVPTTLENDLAGFLLSIQNRDLTPEDYEMLLRLDDSVKAKTISHNVLDHLKTETVGSEVANILMCVICMEPYLEGQVRKFLPCEHDFHSDCINSWLSNSSQNCPLDGLPIGDS